jgi:hypothetical protein
MRDGDGGELAVDDVEVGAADAAGRDPDQHLARAGLPVRQPDHLERWIDALRAAGLPG